MVASFFITERFASSGCRLFASASCPLATLITRQRFSGLFTADLAGALGSLSALLFRHRCGSLLASERAADLPTAFAGPTKEFDCVFRKFFSRHLIQSLHRV